MGFKLDGIMLCERQNGICWSFYFAAIHTKHTNSSFSQISFRFLDSTNKTKLKFHLFHFNIHHSACYFFRMNVFSAMCVQLYFYTT